jgi:hypothetical protein
VTCEEQKYKSIVPWIASVAVSVLCCSILFVLFASFLVDIKADVRENNSRLSLIEQRQDAIFNDLSVVLKHTVIQPTAAQPTDSTSAAPVLPTEPAAQPPVAQPSPAQPSIVQPLAPALAPSVTQPSITVPVMPVTPEAK